MRKALLRFDTACVEKVNGLQSTKSMRVMLKLISFSGDGYLYVLFSMYLFMTDAQDVMLIIAAIALAFGLDLPSFMLLKRFFRRPRPYESLRHCEHGIVPGDPFSMPSGHAAAAALFSVQIAYFFPSYGGMAFAWAMMVGGSRVLLGVHYPSDVFVGFALGVACSVLSITTLV